MRYCPLAMDEGIVTVHESPWAVGVKTPSAIGACRANQARLAPTSELVACPLAVVEAGVVDLEPDVAGRAVELGAVATAVGEVGHDRSLPSRVRYDDTPREKTRRRT